MYVGQRAVYSVCFERQRPSGTNPKTYYYRKAISGLPNGVLSSTTKLTPSVPSAGNVSMNVINAGAGAENYEDTTAYFRPSNVTHQLNVQWSARRAQLVRACVTYTTSLMGSVQPNAIFYQAGFQPRAGSLTVSAFQLVKGEIATWACQYAAQAIDTKLPYYGPKLDAAYVRFTFLIRGLLDRAATAWTLRFVHDGSEISMVQQLPFNLTPVEGVYDYSYDFSVDVNARIWQYATMPTRAELQHEDELWRRAAFRDKMNQARHEFTMQMAQQQSLQQIPTAGAESPAEG